jgi:hypothetical protein
MAANGTTAEVCLAKLGIYPPAAPTPFGERYRNSIYFHKLELELSAAELPAAFRSLQ